MGAASLSRGNLPAKFIEEVEEKGNVTIAFRRTAFRQGEVDDVLAVGREIPVGDDSRAPEADRTPKARIAGAEGIAGGSVIRDQDSLFMIAEEQLVCRSRPARQFAS